MLGSCLENSIWEIVLVFDKDMDVRRMEDQDVVKQVGNMSAWEKNIDTKLWNKKIKVQRVKNQDVKNNSWNMKASFHT